MNAIFTALVTNTRPDLALQFNELKPTVTRAAFGPVIVIRRGSNRLYLYNGMRFQASSASPPARRSTRRRSAACRSSSSGGTRGGTRRTRRGRRARSRSRRGRATRSARAGWASRRSGVGIHGTPDDASIGYSASHGCIRMHVPDAEWLFNHVTSARRSSSSPREMTAPAEARRAGTGGRARGPAARAARLEARARASGKEAATASRRRTSRSAALDAPGKLQLASLRGKVGRAQLLGVVVRPVQGGGAAAGRPAAKRWRGRVVVLGVDANDVSERRAQVRRKFGLTYPIVP